MTRLVLGVVAVLAGLSGCASPARYVQRTGDSGVVAIPANTDSWPSYNRREALALIQKHVGPNFEIIEENEVPTGKKTFNDQQVNNEQTWNNSNPFLPANKQTVQNTTTTMDVMEYRIAYRKKAMPTPFTGELNARGPMGAPMNGMAPAGGGTGVQPAGGVPQMGGVQPAYGAQPPAGVVPPVGPVGYGAPAGPIAPAGGPMAPTGGPVAPTGAYVNGSVMFGQMR